MNFSQLLEKYRKISFSQADKGNRFERLMQAYLLTDPIYSSRFENVWLWNDFFAKDDLGGHDTGIDLVGKATNGDFWAIQCKCYHEDNPIDKPAVDSFLSTSGRSFTDENSQTVRFSHRLWISTTNKWTANAEEAIKNQTPSVSRLNLYELQNSAVDWDKLENNVHGEEALKPKKKPFSHQAKAVEDSHEYFKNHDRGKLIMACGTGKTFTSLKIAERETNGKGIILFLVPSIALLGQILSEWYAEAQEKINAICICSDPKVSQKRNKNEDTDTSSVVDLALPASTNVEQIIAQFKSLNKQERNGGKCGMTVVFSTYQSIEVISKAQKALAKELPQYAEFDLIVCDEAHRTTGVTLANQDESAFVKVHDNDFLSAKKRLYMTATPRLYSDETKSKAAQADAILCSMDDEKMYGKEIYRIGFGEAVDKRLLTDYKVLILTLNQNDVPPAVQKMIAGDTQEINTDDAAKLIGCINALSKQVLGDDDSIKKTDPKPMKRAVAFCSNIATSKKITNIFNEASEEYISELSQEKQKEMQDVKSKHIDGTMSALERNDMMQWLKDEPAERECRLLTNVRCLSEGVDVPSLDAVLFLSARNSQVDVVQSVGRVMRVAPNKKYGYIIIPVLVPSDVEPEKALDDNERYKVVWTVLNALRAHDDRFNATVNKLELNKKKPTNILVGAVSTAFDEDGNPIEKTDTQNQKDFPEQLRLKFEKLQSVIFAKMVQKVGDKRYWEQWAKSVAEIAERQIERITKMIKSGEYKTAFDQFLLGLQKNINPSISQQDAIEMLSQHIITKPVFEALFEGYSFVKNNPISVSMQGMLDILETQAVEKDTETLRKFYDSVRMRASGIDNAEGKQRIIIELYDKFFKTAFPKMVERLGIVYTPVEVVDFIIHSVNDVLKQEFGRTVSDKNVNVLDPFTGTGTFITRLIQSGLIEQKDLQRKYQHELFANEIVLLAYYIAAVNIENAYHDAMQTETYHSFEGICLTDTFQLGETDDASKLFSEMFPQNSERVQRQKNTPITVIMGNPPYSIGQKSANDNAQNQEYKKLNKRIEDTYAKASNAGLNKSLYDAYIKAFRWSADRLENNDGIIAFVSNGAWLDGNSTDGFRKCLENEFSSIYVFNLRGNCRTSGELRQKEAGNVFGLGSRTPIAITILVKRKNENQDKAKIHYHDIGDYLTREQKMAIIKKFGTISSVELSALSPNEHGDWLNQRNDAFSSFIPLEPEKKFDVKTQSFFIAYSLGIVSARDAWVYNFSKTELTNNVNTTIDYYNEQLRLLLKNEIKEVQKNSSKGNWTRDWDNQVKRGRSITENTDEYRIVLHRPFTKTNNYFDDDLNQERYQLPKIFPTTNHKNLVIGITGIGSSKDFSVLITNMIPDYQVMMNGQCFPLYYYEENKKRQEELFDGIADQVRNDGFIRRDAISDFILERAKQQYGKNVTKEDIFYYVYGFLHSPNYRETFASDLKKMLPRLPLVDDVRDFWAFSKAGRKLAELHLNYETLVPSPNVKIIGDNGTNYDVEKMRFPSKTDKSKIIYNSRISIENIPETAYQYVVNGKSAIEWIMERYQITTHKESGIVNNPNDWAKENSNPRYILDLLLSVIHLSEQTVEIVNGLPKQHI